MVHTVPGSLIISPTPITDLLRIKFSFRAALDYADYAFVFGFHAKYYVIYRNSSLTIWKQLTVLDCNNCVNMSLVAPSDLSIEYDHIPEGTYDFMVIEQGDWAGTGKDDPTRYAILNGVNVEHAVSTDESKVIITVSPSGATVNVGGNAVYSSADSYEISGKIGSSKIVTISKSGYITQSVQVPFVETTTRLTFSLDVCYPGATGCGVPATTTKTCLGMNRDGNFDISCITDPQNTMYLYGAIGIVALVLFLPYLSKRGGGSGGGGKRDKRDRDL